jgi:hypothetical protein
MAVSNQWLKGETNFKKQKEASTISVYMEKKWFRFPVHASLKFAALFGN